MGGTTATTDSGIMNGAEANAAYGSGGLGGSGISEQDYARMSGERIPDFYDDAGNPVYLGGNTMQGQWSNGAPSTRDKMLRAMSKMGGGGTGGGAGGMPTQPMETGGGGSPSGQYYTARPWQIPNAHSEQVDQAYAGAIQNIFKMMAGGM
jgi:hypothetical protein